MSNIDKQAQGEKTRETFERWAEQSGALPWGILKKHRNQDGTYPGPHYTYMWHAWNACHEALLDELEAKDNRINRLEAIVAVAEQRNALMREWKRDLKVPCDLVDDQVPVVIHGMVIRLERLKEAEAKLEAAEKRIAELEARKVTLPVNITSANAPEVFEIAAEAERLGLRGTYASYAVGWNARGIADKEALREAGVKVAAAAGKGE
ncbi:TPA: hypothetical protein JG839_003249 [Enterobacter hormaechei subsp. steigerwaltii]|nr:hypothetical protein [Enterobacter hormaechei subsp. steigerwaltii]